MTDIRPESSKNIKFVGYTDQAGRSDGVSVCVNKGFAYVSHPFSTGASVIDVRDPRNPKPTGFLPVHPASWSLHLQTHDQYLLVVEEFNFYSVYFRESDYYGKSIENVHSSMFGTRGKDYSAGLRIYDISTPGQPRAVGFMGVEGLGLHRVFWTGGRYAYASAFLDGFTDHVLICIDLYDMTKPLEVGRWWIPGMWKEGGEIPTWSGRVALHHATVYDDIAYGCWRDGGVTALDVKDPSKPTLISHTNWCPPFAGGTHSATALHDRNLLVVADEAVADISVEPQKHTWVLDIRYPARPVTISTVPIPAECDFKGKGGHFGPHNLWENRPDGLQTSQYIFATYQNAGLRVYDIANPFRPEEVAYFVPPAPKHMIDPRPDIKPVLHSADLYVQKDGLIYMTDFNAGLYIMEWIHE